jgi:hypothetical protein
MQLLSKVRVATVALATAFVLLFAAVAYGATSGTYKGKTSQRLSITFKVAGGAIKGLDFHIRDKCPDGRTLTVHNSGFPSIKISHNKFGGTFGPSGQPTVIQGKFSGKKATGSLKDSTVSSSTGLLCKGSATFTATTK